MAYTSPPDMYTIATANFQLVAELVLRSTGLLSFWLFIVNGIMLAEGIATSMSREVPETLPKDACDAGQITGGSINRSQKSTGRRTHLCRYGHGRADKNSIALLFLVLVCNSRAIGQPGQEYVHSTQDFNEPNPVNIPMQQHPIDPGMQRNITLLTNTSRFLQRSIKHGGLLDRKLQEPMQKEVEFVLTKMNENGLRSSTLILVPITIAIVTILCMMQQQRGSRLARVPDPPAWNPDDRHAMPYRVWTQRLMVWGILAVDLDPSQQCAAIVERLGGSARVLADSLSWQEMTQGGTVGGQQMGPVTFLLTQLAAHYAPFGEEQRIDSMVELMAFRRLPGEATDALVARFRTIRWRAAQGGAGMLLNWEGYSWLFL